jgi:hypothetical protein
VAGVAVCGLLRVLRRNSLKSIRLRPMHWTHTRTSWPKQCSLIWYENVRSCGLECRGALSLAKAGERKCATRQAGRGGPSSSCFPARGYTYGVTGKLGKESSRSRTSSGRSGLGVAFGERAALVFSPAAFTTSRGDLSACDSGRCR